ncbi:MAG: NAD+ synthase [Actinomycetota bacterium]
MIRIALAQVNPTVGALEANAALVCRFIEQAKSAGADVVAFPEMVIPGYPPDDLLLNKSFLTDTQQALESILPAARGIAAIVGSAQEEGGRLFNVAALLARGTVCGIYRKHELPNYGVFDERRFFSPGDETVLGKLDEHLFGLTVCEDLWLPDGPHQVCAAAGARLVININASPYHRGKGRVRRDLLAERARLTGMAIAYVNCVGGGDEVVFDGQSFAMAPDATILARAGQFSEELLVFDWDPDLQSDPAPVTRQIQEAVSVVDLGPAGTSREPIQSRVEPELTEEAEVYAALELGVRDYLNKNGFTQAIVGVSGGIDSALTATIATDALGAGNVLGISNPSEFTSSQSTQDAKQLAQNLGIDLITLPIPRIHQAFRDTLSLELPGAAQGLTDQNVQARIRGTLWMAVSNFTGRMVLSTGNKSEMATGYATLYGDMAGGFAVLKDVPKTLVYRLAAWRNGRGEAIPPSVIERAPTAELAPHQLDTDNLPPYEVLDPILAAYVEDNLDIEQIAAMGFDRATVAKVIALVDRAEYKRRQAPPGVKITKRAFGRDRRLPITNRFRPR